MNTYKSHLEDEAAHFAGSAPVISWGNELAGRGLPSDHKINQDLFGQEVSTQVVPNQQQGTLETTYPDHLVASTEIVDDLASAQQERVKDLRERGISPSLDIFECGGNKDNISYAVRAKAYGARIGVDVKVHRTKSDEPVSSDGPMTDAELTTMAAVAQSRQTPYGGRLVLGPTETREGWRWVQAASGDNEPDSGDLDGVGNLIPSTRPGPVATTAAAMVLYAEKLLGGRLEELRKDEIGLVGNGGVGGPLGNRILAKRRMTPGVWLRTATEVRSAGDHLKDKPMRIIFATGRANGILQADDITPPEPDELRFSGKTLIIDAGNAPHPVTGEFGGNTALNTLEGSNVYATPFIGGVGPVTVALLFDRLLDKTEQDYQRQTEQQRVGRIAGYLASLKNWLRPQSAAPQNNAERPDQMPGPVKELVDAR